MASRCSWRDNEEPAKNKGPIPPAGLRRRARGGRIGSAARLLFCSKTWIDIGSETHWQARDSAAVRSSRRAALPLTAVPSTTSRAVTADVRPIPAQAHGVSSLSARSGPHVAARPANPFARRISSILSSVERSEQALCCTGNTSGTREGQDGETRAGRVPLERNTWPNWRNPQNGGLRRIASPVRPLGMSGHGEETERRERRARSGARLCGFRGWFRRLIRGRGRRGGARARTRGWNRVGGR